MRTFMSCSPVIGFCCCIPPPASADDRCAQWRVPQDWTLPRITDLPQNIWGYITSSSTRILPAMRRMSARSGNAAAICWRQRWDYNGTVDRLPLRVRTDHLRGSGLWRRLAFLAGEHGLCRRRLERSHLLADRRLQRGEAAKSA